MRILITTGPTREAIDPVRFLSNRSSGRMGFAIAEAALAAGHEVVLIAGPCDAGSFSEKIACGALQRVDVVSAEDMYGAVEKEIGEADAAVMAAAVADYRPVNAREQKIKKTVRGMILELEATRDILGSAREAMKFSGVLVGFAAETENLEANAASKLERKGCDLVVANDVGRSDIGFDAAENELLLLYAGGGREVLPKSLKSGLGVALVARIERIAAEKAKKV